MVHTLRVTISSLCHFCLLLCQSWGIPDSSIWSISCFLSQTILVLKWPTFTKSQNAIAKSFWEQRNLNFQVYVVTAAFRLAACPHWQALSTLLGTLITCYTCGYISELLLANQTRLYFITRHTHHIFSIKTTIPLYQSKLESSPKLQTTKCWDFLISQLIFPRLSAPLLLKNAEPSLGSSHPWRLLLPGESLCNWFNSELKDWNEMYVQKISKKNHHFFFTKIAENALFKPTKSLLKHH